MDPSSLLLRWVPDTRRSLNVWRVVRGSEGLPPPIVITPVPFDTPVPVGIAEPTCTIAAQFGEPEATRILFQRVAVPRRLKTSQVHARNKAIHRGPR